MNDSSYPQSKSELLRFEGRDEAQAIALLMAQQAKRQICILGRDIDHALFDKQEFVDCISDLARRSPTTQVRILVHDTRLNQQNGHRLIPLAQHLTSSIHIHNTAKQHRDLQTTQLLVDDFAYLSCPRAAQYDGYANLYDRLEVRQLQQKFDELWQQSSPDITVRRLDL
jgi:hypothetical protein